jgi:Protein of unknown function (DUF2867)
VPQVSAPEFEQLPLRVHTILAGVPLHDAWAIELPHSRAGITLDEFLRATKGGALKPSAVVRLLLGIRLFVGRLFGWDHEKFASAPETFASRLTFADLDASLVPAGTQDGAFHVVYRFENEQLVELINRTVHAGALTALLETGSAYRFYLGIYVRRLGWFTRLYMAIIDPVRRLVVYPSLLRSVRTRWIQTYGA